VKVPEPHAKSMLTKFVTRLAPEELDALHELVKIMRIKTPFWAAT